MTADVLIVAVEEEMHVVSSLCQLATVVAPDRTGADDSVGKMLLHIADDF
jgi:hypothetical protein